MITYWEVDGLVCCCLRAKEGARESRAIGGLLGEIMSSGCFEHVKEMKFKSRELAAVKGKINIKRKGQGARWPAVLCQRVNPAAACAAGRTAVSDPPP